MKTPQEQKASILAHCLWMSELEPAYAIKAAKWYERMLPWLVPGLEATIREAVQRREDLSDDPQRSDRH